MADAIVSLACRGVTFSYGRKLVLDDVDLEVGRGVTGLLGPNGSGKSTLLGILATILKPSSGTVSLNGTVLENGDISLIRRSIGFLPQQFDLMQRASVLRNVAYAAWCNGIDRDECESAAIEALEVVDMEQRSTERVASLSGGQRQRVGIACCIAHHPSVVLLDEPTVGLDPAQRVQLRSYLAAIAERSTVLLSTHIVEDLAQMAQRVIVIESGQVILCASMGELIERGHRSALAGDAMSEIEAGYLSLLVSHGKTAP